MRWSVSVGLLLQWMLRSWEQFKTHHCHLDLDRNLHRDKLILMGIIIADYSFLMRCMANVNNTY